MRIASFHLPLSLLFWNCAGSTVFRRPPGPGYAGDFRDNPQYALGEIVDLQWETDDTSNDLFIVQTTPEEEIITHLFLSEYRPFGWVWNVSFDGFPPWHDPDLSNVYYLHLQPADQNDAGVTCHYFNITRSDASSVSSSASSSTPPSSSTLSTSVASPTTTPSATSTPELGRDELSIGAVAGTAVAATFVGTLVVVGLAGFLFWRRWKNKKKRERGEAAAMTTANDENEIHIYKRDLSLPPRELYVEGPRRLGTEGLEPSEMRFEMSGDSVVRKRNVEFC
ncbi:hypothetical protein CFIO01_04438 [Colletotrichum fioriniae PJ7]|uniref:Uncharacterized protein n=1 Tax=Colletotrichum fioriniae PJ7 TaxID=1445577 RepID=A0A010R9R5_9PEZI|nr:hypothetical protein CFIO01_04438 [Colletotrichum fioriniae PJ7]